MNLEDSLPIAEGIFPRSIWSPDELVHREAVVLRDALGLALEAPALLDIGVAVAIEQPREDLRLDRAFFDLLHPLLVERIGFLERHVGVFGVDRTDKGNVLAIARPYAGRGFGAEIGQLLRLAAVERD